MNSYDFLKYLTVNISAKNLSEEKSHTCSATGFYAIINNIPNDIPQIYADRDRFEQVVINLIENAVKYANEDTEIVLDSAVTENRVCIEVKNKCKQIGREKLNTLFDKFTRLDDSKTRTTRGTGLGLYIVKGLVDAMNGDVKLNSNEEYGFIVKIYFEKVVDVQSY